METGGGLQPRSLVRAFSPPLAATQLPLLVSNTAVSYSLCVINRTAFSFGQHSVSEPLFYTHTDRPQKTPHMLCNFHHRFGDTLSYTYRVIRTPREP